jgi:hypothetical protein
LFVCLFWINIPFLFPLSFHERWALLNCVSPICAFWKKSTV